MRHFLGGDSDFATRGCTTSALPSARKVRRVVNAVASSILRMAAAIALSVSRCLPSISWRHRIALARQLECRDRLHKALERHLADRLDDERLAERGAHPLIDQDLPGIRLAAKPRGEVDDTADRRIIEAALEAECAERRVAARDADAQIEVVAVVEPLRAQHGKALAHRERHARRAPGGLRNGQWIVEEHEDPVACEPIERA